MPLFWPKPTILPTRLGPAPPRSKSWLVGTGQFGFVPVGRKHARFQVSKPCSLFAHLICPVFKSNARAVSRNHQPQRNSRRSRVLASFHTGGCGVSCFRYRRRAYRGGDQSPAVAKPHLRCIRRAFPHCQHVESLPEHRTGFHVERDNTPRKLQHDMRISCQTFFARRDSNINKRGRKQPEIQL